MANGNGFRMPGWAFGSLVTLFVAGSAGAVGYGSMRSEVESLRIEQARLRERVDEKADKGDLFSIRRVLSWVQSDVAIMCTEMALQHGRDPKTCRTSNGE